MPFKKTLCAGIGFSIGIGAGLIAAWLLYPHLCGNHLFINPDYTCGQKFAINKNSYLVFEDELSTYIDEQIKQGKVEQVGMYFRDLRDGPAFGIHQNDLFAPASLLKLPLIIALFSISEEDDDLLKTKITYTRQGLESFNIPPQVVQPSVGLTEGKEYTLKDLMRAAIEDSDNVAYFILINYANTKIPDGSAKLLRTFQEIGVVDPRNPLEDVVTARTYAGIFRMLYSVSYLSDDDSDEVLSWLAQSTYTTGITAGVPNTIKVANKFGERELPNSSKQLHDCGIIYFPENPYVLCVMTRGNDWNALQTMIADISKRVYEEVDSRRQ